MARFVQGVVALAAVVLLATCGGGESPTAPSGPATLAFTVQPGTVTVGATILPAVQVAVRDTQGNTVSSATSPITVAITSGTGTSGAVLGGTLTRSALGGVATFTDLTIDKTGTGYTLSATATGLTGATSAGFTVNPVVADLEVGNHTDVVDGDVGSVAALVANPGPDGISLREALLAVNATAGRHTVTIATALAGQTVALTSDLPPVTRDSITLIGLAGTDGKPAFTLDASGINGPAALIVHASDFTLRYFRIRNIPLHASAALYIEAGQLYAGEPGPVKTRIERVSIEDSEFTNEALVYSPTSQTHAISVRGDPFTSDLTVSDVTIRGNRFAGFKGDSDAILAGIGGARCVLERLVVIDNSFIDNAFGIEVGGHTGPQNVVRGLRIVANTIVGGSGGVVIGIGGEANVFEDALVEDNTITSRILLGTADGTGSRLRDLRFRNNSGFAGIFVYANGSANTIDQLLIEGNSQDPATPEIAIDMVGLGTGTVIQDTRIADNVLVGNVSLRGGQGPVGGAAATDNLLVRTVLERNRIGGVLSVKAGIENATANEVRELWAGSNLLLGGVDIAGGIVGASGNRVDDVTLIGNTIARQGARGVQVFSDAEGGAGNTVAQVRIVNAIISAPQGDFDGELTPADVHFTLTSDPTFAGVNGNITGDPGFADPVAGDYRLRAGSPAIDAGTSDSAPALDLLGCLRFDDPAVPNTGAGSQPFHDLGALERGPCGGSPRLRAPPQPQIDDAER